MEEIKIKGKAIYTTNGAAREYGRIGCNFYKGCPHNCQYCYLKRGAPSKNLGGNEVQLKKCFKDEDDAIEKFKKDMERYKDVLKKTGVFFSFTTDPLIPETRKLTKMAMIEAYKRGIHVYVLTKDANFFSEENEYLAWLVHFEKLSFSHLFNFGFTLTGRDDMEPNASTNAERIEAMRRLYKLGFRTWASIEPVIDWKSAWKAVDMSIDCCDHYKIGLRSGVKKDYYDLAQSGVELDDLTRMIYDEGRTIYLKESARALLRRCFREDHYNKILSRTVDMDGNKITFETTD